MASKISRGASGQAGQATIESAAVLLALSGMISVILCFSYVITARAWLGFAAEQTLYCMTENRGRAPCEAALRERVRRALPLGRLARVALTPEEDRWTLDLEWHWARRKVQVHRALLLPDLIHGRRALR